MTAAGELLAPRSRLRREVRRRPGDDARRPHEDRLQEPLQRRPQREGPVPARGPGREDQLLAQDRRHASASWTARASPTVPRRRSSAAPRTLTSTNDNPIFIKALSFVAGPSEGAKRQDYDFTTFPGGRREREGRLRSGGHRGSARADSAWPEVHDCFTPTELVLMEDLGFLASGSGLEGHDGRPLRPRRRPAGQPGRRPEELRPSDRRFRPADDVRDVAPAPRLEAGERQIADPKVGLTHNLGGAPGRCVSFVSVVGPL